MGGLDGEGRGARAQPHEHPNCLLGKVDVTCALMEQKVLFDCNREQTVVVSTSAALDFIANDGGGVVAAGPDCCGNCRQKPWEGGGDVGRCSAAGESEQVRAFRRRCGGRLDGKGLQKCYNCVVRDGDFAHRNAGLRCHGSKRHAPERANDGALTS